MEVLPVEPGATGEAVRDLQRRLAAISGEALAISGRYDDSTEAAVRSFQEQRGLLVTGCCDRHTWSALVEAGYRLGDRLLYHRTPMLRGDDVAELQRRVGALGFDAGRVDGIFGPLTERALKDFQRNAGITTDGVCGPDVLAELRRVAGKVEASSTVAGVRERDRLRHAPRVLLERRVVIGQLGGLDVMAAAMSRMLHEGGAVVATLAHPEPSVQAAEANRFEGELFIGLSLDERPPCEVTYYATTGFESAGGRRLAELIHAELAGVSTLELAPVRGMRIPVLRETRMPAVMCQLGPAGEVVPHSGDLARALTRALGQWVAAPVDS
jgi:N-acetylmuramoyl-L-alanine amidase